LPRRIKGGALSEGQLARGLRLDRVEARRTLARLERNAGVTAEGQFGQQTLDPTLSI